MVYLEVLDGKLSVEGWLRVPGFLKQFYFEISERDPLSKTRQTLRVLDLIFFSKSARKIAPQWFSGSQFVCFLKDFFF